MGRGRPFWGLLLLMAGALLLLNNLGLLPLRIGDLIWPLLIVLVGLWILLRSVFSGRSLESQELVIPLQEARKAHLRLQYGAGRLTATSGAEGAEFLRGRFEGGVDVRQSSQRDNLEVELAVPEDRWLDLFTGLGSNGGLAWTIQLNPHVPLVIEMQMGAGDARLNFEDLLVQDLRIKTGASSTTVRLPIGAGETKVHVEAGVASVALYVPESVGARISTQGALADFKVDRKRFLPRGDSYESEGFDAAQNRVEISIEAGVGAVSVS